LVITEFSFESGCWVRLPDTGIDIRMYAEPVGGLDELRQLSRRSIGRALAEHRLALGLTQAELADRLCRYQSTVTRHEVSRWERGARLPRGAWLEQIEVELDLTEPVRRAIGIYRHPSVFGSKQLRLAVNDPAHTTDAATLPPRQWTPVPGCPWRVRPVSSRHAMARAMAAPTTLTRAARRGQS
jgi:transcriptional regulator with XRE-family HTH domain